MNLNNIKNNYPNLFLAINSVLLAGESVMKIYNSAKIEIEIKPDKSPLTEADKSANTIIKKQLKSTSFNFLSEEESNIDFQKRKKWKKFWLVDPIDGTKEFIKRNGEFTINIALIEKNRTLLGVVYSPYLKELFFAHKNIGSFKINNITSIDEFKLSEKINLSKSIAPKAFTIVVSRSHMNQKTNQFIYDIKSKYNNVSKIAYGSSLKLCRVAEGKAHCYPRFGPTMEWDTAAADAVATFAGCKLFSVETKKELIYNKNNLLNPFFILKRSHV